MRYDDPKNYEGDLENDLVKCPRCGLIVTYDDYTLDDEGCCCVSCHGKSKELYSGEK